MKSKSKKCNTKTPEMSDSGKNWNVVTGCNKYSDGCLNCYGEPTAEWLINHLINCVIRVQGDCGSTVKYHLPSIRTFPNACNGYLFAIV